MKIIIGMCETTEKTGEIKNTELEIFQSPGLIATKFTKIAFYFSQHFIESLTIKIHSEKMKFEYIRMKL